MFPALRLTDPLTHQSLDQGYAPRFPIVVVRGDAPELLQLDDPGKVPPLASGATYLIPSGRESTFARYLNDHFPSQGDGVWNLRVERVASDRQRIELFVMGDGFSGGVYEATPTSVTPLYRKSTGPAFAFVFGGLALIMNLALWGAVMGVVVIVRRLR